jgi:hypothetical protein
MNRRRIGSKFLHPGTHPATIQRLPGPLSLGVQQLRRAAELSPPFSAEIKNEWSSSSMAISRTASLFALVHHTKSKESENTLNTFRDSPCHSGSTD